MALPKILQKLFANSGAGPKLREDIMPKDYLPTAGGTMTGTIKSSYVNYLTGTSNDKRKHILSGTTVSGGAFIALDGSEVVEDGDSIKGSFKIVANNGTTQIALRGNPDGTLAWNDKIITLTGDCLSLTGGTMGGTIKFGVQMALVRNTNNSRLEIAGGTSSSYGASIYLDGVDRAYTPGSFGMTARNAEGTTKSFFGNASGNLTWNGKEIERVNSSGTGYIRYESGLQICWGADSFGGAGSKQITWPVAFADAVYSALCTYITETPSVAVSVSSITTTSTTFYRNYTGSEGFFRYVAIGRWK